MISELYVPREHLDDFLGNLAQTLKKREATLIYGTVRIIEKDDETFLPWARDRFACVVLNLLVEHTDSGKARARETFRELIDLALERGGNYFLTYHGYASRRQLLEAYPNFAAFLEKKETYDPSGVFQSDWYLRKRRLLHEESSLSKEAETNAS